MRAARRTLLTAACLTGSLVSVPPAAAHWKGQWAPWLPKAEQNEITSRSVYSDEAMLLDWPVSAENSRYKGVSNVTARRVAEKLAEVAQKRRDEGKLQFWGRIQGTAAHDDATRWLAAEFKRMGVSDVQSIRLPLPPQNFPSRWSARVGRSGRMIELQTATAYGHEDLGKLRPFRLAGIEVTYVGLGTAADFKGRDVRGKAVMIYSQPMPSLWRHSAVSTFDSVSRARSARAAAIILTVGLPGNVTGQTLMPASDIPAFTIGADEFASVRTMLEDSDAPLKFDASFEIDSRTNAKTSLVIGHLPGTTDENIFLSAHVDGYYEGFYDNGAGVGALMAIAEHFAKVPQGQRRRNIYFVVNPGHHEPHRVGSQWLARNWADKLKNAALIANLEHPPYIQSVLYADGWRPGTSGSASMAWYAGGSDRFRKISIDALRSFGIGTYLRPNPEIGDDATLFSTEGGVQFYGQPGDIGDLSHFGPFFQALSADWPYHTNADVSAIIHWPGVANYARAYARVVDQVNTLSLSELRGPGHPNRAAR